MSNSVLSLFEGLDEQQARKFRQAIENQVMPELWELRAQIIAERKQGDSNQSKEEVIHNGKMSRQNETRRGV